jgi:hypothetical protein
MNYLPLLALNCDPPDLCLLSSKDYGREPLAPSLQFIIPDFCTNFYFLLLTLALILFLDPLGGNLDCWCQILLVL